MKKFLAAVMAAAMVVSMTAVASFAKPAVAPVTAKVVVTIAGTPTETDETYVLSVAGTTVTGTALATGAVDTLAGIAGSFNTKTFVVDGVTFTAAVSGAVVTFTGDSAKTSTLSDTASIAGTAVPAAGVTATAVVTQGVTGSAATSVDAVAMNIAGPYVEAAGDMVNGIVKPAKTIYYTINQAYAGNPDWIKLTLKKGDSSKNIESVKIVEKKFDNEFVPVDTAAPTSIANTRLYFVAVKLKDQKIDSEYKVNFSIKASVKKTGTAPTFGAVTAGDTVAEKTYDSAWVNNNVQTGDDLEYKAGTGGVMSKPVKDDENTVTWIDENRTLATMVFTADSSVAAYYPKLSTQWDNEFYGMHFATDAYKFEFVGNPTVSATARPVVSLMNPFIVDDEYTVDAADLTVYRVVDGALVDATAEFTATENDDGEQVLVTKTRTLGTYVVTDAEAVLEAATPEDVVDADKVVPNTGR